MANTPITYASVASRLTDEEILELANYEGYSGVAAVLRDYVRLRRLNCELRKSLKQAIDGCAGCKNVGECGSPLPFKGCKRKDEWHNLLAEAEKGEANKESVEETNTVAAMLRQAADAEEENARLKARLDAVVKECEGLKTISESIKLIPDDFDAILSAARGESENENK